MTSVTALVKEVQQKENRIERMRSEAEQKEGVIETIAVALGTRTALKVVTTFIPAIEPLKPILEIGGALFAAKKALELDDNSEKWTGAAVGLGIGAADRLGDFVLNSINKFKKPK